MTKNSPLKKRFMENTPDSSAHLSSLNKVTDSLADEANKTVKIIICLLLILSTFSVYWQVQDHEFIGYDDNIIITDNLNVQAGLTKEIGALLHGVHIFSTISFMG